MPVSHRNVRRVLRLSTLLLLVTSSTRVMAAPVYPLKVSANRRYLVDQLGAPFLIAGDAPQALIVNLTVSDAVDYLANRQARGFNTLWINLLCAEYTAGRSDGSTLDGIRPFHWWTPSGAHYDLQTPNEAYFQRADAMLQAAAQRDLTVFLDPIETGGSWMATLRDNGLDRAYAFGRYLGTRYASFDNLVWLHGNDFQTWRTSSDEQLAFAVARGIRDTDPRHLHTVMLDYPVSSSTDSPTWSSLVDIDTVYSYPAPYIQSWKSYNRTPTRPIYMAETSYEYEAVFQSAPPSPRLLRSFEYWSDLSGNTGQFYGNHYIWRFESNWRSFLDSPGALQMQHVQKLLQSRPWYELEPDQTGTVLTAGQGASCEGVWSEHCDRAIAARTTSGSLVLAYMPSARSISIDMAKLNAPAQARWYDPSAGLYTPIAGSPLANTAIRSFTPPGANAEGASDWVLVLETNQNAVPALSSVARVTTLGLLALAGCLRRSSRRRSPASPRLLAL